MTGLPLATIEVAFSSVFPFQIKSTIAHTEPAIPLMQVARFETEVTGSNLHPKLETSYTVVPQHFITTCSGCASTLWHFAQHQICDLGFWNTAAGENTHTCETGEPTVRLVSPQNTTNTWTPSTLCNSCTHSWQYCTYPLATKQGSWLLHAYVALDLIFKYWGFLLCICLKLKPVSLLISIFCYPFFNSIFFSFFLLRPHSNKVDTQSEAFWK